MFTVHTTYNITNDDATDNVTRNKSMNNTNWPLNTIGITEILTGRGLMSV